MYSIYKITNLINGDFYIGLTTKKFPKARFGAHLRLSKNGRGHHLHAAMRAYGVDNFSFSILEQGEGNFHDGCIVETRYISALQPRYNETLGGEGFTGKHTEEHKKHLSVMYSGNKNHFFGKTHTEETRKLISERRKGTCKGPDNPFYGKVHSQEVKDRLSKMFIGRFVGNKNGFFGKKHSDESKRKIKEAWVMRKARLAASKLLKQDTSLEEWL